MTRYAAYQQWVDKSFEDSHQGIQWNQCLIDDGSEDLLDALVENEKMIRTDAFIIAYAEYRNQELQAELNKVRNELESVQK